MKDRKLLSTLVMATLLLGLVLSCRPAAPPPTPTPVPPTRVPREVLGLPGELAGMTWEDIVEEARNQKLSFWHWGGSERGNKWFDEYWGEELSGKYDITLSRVPVSDAPQFVNQVLGEKEAGKDTNGSVDIVWINGENFITMFEADLLYGPYADKLPNAKYYNMEALRWDWGYDNEFYESPLGTGQLYFAYDSAKVPDPPQTWAELEQWIKDNPGKFTYPQMPMFDGTRFVKQILYYTTDGYRQWLGPYNEELWNEKSPELWKWLTEIKPYLWREGETYPVTRASLDQLFADGEIWITFTGDLSFGAKVEDGLWPETTRPLIPEDGTIGGHNYLAISYNSPHKAAALVLADLAMAPEMQLYRADPKRGGGAGPAIRVSSLPEEMQTKFKELSEGEYSVSMAELAEHRLPETVGVYNRIIEKEWRKYVLEGQPIPGTE